MKSLLLLCCLLVVDTVDQPVFKRRGDVPCWQIRPYIWIYGEEAAVAWAKAHHYSDAQIMAVKRRCKS